MEFLLQNLLTNTCLFIPRLIQFRKLILYCDMMAEGRDHETAIDSHCKIKSRVFVIAVAVFSARSTPSLYNGSLAIARKRYSKRH
jgi:hypothetical protein